MNVEIGEDERRKWRSEVKRSDEVKNESSQTLNKSMKDHEYQQDKTRQMRWITKNELNKNKSAELE